MYVRKAALYVSMRYASSMASSVASTNAMAPRWDLAKEGFQSGDFYEKFRPSYTDEAVNFVLEKLKIDKHVEGALYDVFELGAGTGKFTRCLRKAAGESVRIAASEPTPSFLRALKETVEGVDVLGNAAQHIELPDKSVKGIVAATAFHWFATVDVLQEIHRVLTPGGSLVLLWNIRDESVPWIHAVQELRRTYEKDSYSYIRSTSANWRTCFEQFDGFSSLQEQIMSGPSLEGDIEFILDNICSISYIACLDVQSKEQARERFHKVISNYVDVESKKKLKIPYNTRVNWCVKREAASS